MWTKYALLKTIYIGHNRLGQHRRYNGMVSTVGTYCGGNAREAKEGSVWRANRHVGKGTETVMKDGYKSLSRRSLRLSTSRPA